MKDDYTLKGPTVQVTLQLEQEVSETLKKMVEYTHFGESEILNVALKRFIAVHSDFVPNKKK
jgi:hypothetical protein